MNSIDIFAQPEPASDLSLEIHARALAQIETLRQRDSHRVLLIAVEPGGCSGFVYTFSLQSHIPATYRAFADGRVACPAAAVSLLAATILDFETTLCGSRFVLRPRDHSLVQCSCGISLSRKET